MRWLAVLEPAQIGKRIVLGPRFEGGARNLTATYQDAMAIVRDKGTPDLFITATCNPKWPEITRELRAGQTLADRPDLCARVFALKLGELLDDLLKRNVLGQVR